MIQLHYLGIQGQCAPAFWFRHQDTENFRSFIESITLRQALLISSIYRSDLFYYSENHNCEKILKSWTCFKFQKYSEKFLSKFHRETGLKSTLEYYFDSLIKLMPQTQYFLKYKDQIQEIAQREFRNPIFREIINCDLHLTTHYKASQITHPNVSANLSGTPKIKASFQYFDHLSLDYLSKMHFN